MEKLSHHQQLIKQFMTEFAAIVEQKSTLDLSIPIIFDNVSKIFPYHQT